MHKLSMASSMLLLSVTASSADHLKLYNGLGDGLFSPAMYEIAQAVKLRCGNSVSTSIHGHGDMTPLSVPKGRLFIAAASAGVPTAIQLATDYRRPVAILFTLDPVKVNPPIPSNVQRHYNWQNTLGGLGGGLPPRTKTNFPKAQGHLDLIGDSAVRNFIVRAVCGR